LVASVFTADDPFARDAVLGLGASHGRVMVIDDAVGKLQTGHGIVMPMCVHGGPGRAGGGEELGGGGGPGFYPQRPAGAESSAGYAACASTTSGWRCRGTRRGWRRWRRGRRRSGCRKALEQLT